MEENLVLSNKITHALFLNPEVHIYKATLKI